MAESGAAVVIIGNEVLSHKVQEQNGALLIRRLHERGVPLRELCIVPDEVDAIVAAVSRSLRRAETVITSGGIGPTHDDVTVRAVALALGRKVARIAQLAEEVKKHYGEGATDEALRLADAPEGAELIRQEGVWYPVLSCAGVYMLPGVPQLFRIQLEVVLARLTGQKVHLRSLFLGVGEARIAKVLDAVALAMPDVAIGSYPQFDKDADHQVKVTIEHADPARVAAAVDRLTRELPGGSILKTE